MNRRSKKTENETEIKGSDQNKLSSKQDLTPSKRKRSRDSNKERGRALLEKKKTATSLKFSQDELERSDEEITEASDDDILPQMKKRTTAKTSPAAKLKKSQQKPYEGRKVWTDIEKMAIKEGIENYGMGKWAKIKADNAEILKDRTSGQIKDCVRTMKKKGELDDVKGRGTEEDE